MLLPAASTWGVTFRADDVSRGRIIGALTSHRIAYLFQRKRCSSPTFLECIGVGHDADP